jgi:23S rRNA (uridine2479-2'-O)-methyltransferase
LAGAERRPGGAGRSGPVLRVSKRNALFQEWLALKTNRQKRHRAGLFLVEGTTAVDQAVAHGWPIEAFVHPLQRELSPWAQAHLSSGVARQRVEMDPELLGELCERHEGTELLGSLELREPWLLVVVDRPKSPGNLGSVIRSAVAFDAGALITTGHAADPFDPACVRASVGTLFDLPLVRLPSQAPLLEWLAEQRQQVPLRVVGTGQDGSVLLDRIDLTGNTVIVFGNETVGLSQAYRAGCDHFAALPTSSRQSSLNVSAAAAIVLYEVRRQRTVERE